MNTAVDHNTALAVEYVPLSNLEILDRKNDCRSIELRILVNKVHVVYVTITTEKQNLSDLSLTELTQKLPPFPVGDWNWGYVKDTADCSALSFVEVCRKELPSVSTTLWHTETFNISSFEIQGCGIFGCPSHNSISCNEHVLPKVVKRAIHPKLGVVMIKFSMWRDVGDMSLLSTETETYGLIKGHQIGPEFLGHLAYEDRVIGFVLENIEGRPAELSDRPDCVALLRRLHMLGIIHGDAHQNNFIISDRAILIDFESTTKTRDEKLREKDLGHLP